VKTSVPQISINIVCDKREKQKKISRLALVTLKPPKKRYTNMHHPAKNVIVLRGVLVINIFKWFAHAKISNSSVYSIVRH
jgi:hypothetical protein